MLSRTPWTPKPEVKRRQQKLSKEARNALVSHLAQRFRRAEPTQFRFEADARNSLRAGLCLSGWNWQLADVIAAEMTRRALAQVGAVRPMWVEGQPGFTTGIMLVVDRCLNCGEPLLSRVGTKFCSRSCAVRRRNITGGFEW